MNQHLVSQVYLKQYGFIDTNKQWKICVLDISQFPIMVKNNKRWIAKKSIESFLAIDNHFDFENVDEDNFKRLIENANSEVETHLPEVVIEIKNDGKLSLKTEAILAHFISNIYVRTSKFDSLVENLLVFDSFDRFVNECSSVLDDLNKKEIEQLIVKKGFKTTKNILNISRFLFWNYFLQRLQNFEYYILFPFEGKGWLSCDNPVVLNKHIRSYSLLSLETEIIFPLEKGILIALKMAEAKKASKFFLNLVSKKSYVMTSEDTDHINKIIWSNAQRFVFFPQMEETHF